MLRVARAGEDENQHVPRRRRRRLPSLVKPVEAARAKTTVDGAASEDDPNPTERLLHLFRRIRPRPGRSARCASGGGEQQEDNRTHAEGRAHDLILDAHGQGRSTARACELTPDLLDGAARVGGRAGWRRGGSRPEGGPAWRGRRCRRRGSRLGPGLSLLELATKLG